MRTIAVLSLCAVPLLLEAQAERQTLTGADIAIYNLAGEIRAVAGTGSDVTVEVTRSGPDAEKLRIETGRIGSRNTLRVIYPDDEILYPQKDHHSSTEVYVNDDGTFGERTHGHRVRIASYGRGLEASAVVRVMIPSGKRVRLSLAVGSVTVTNVSSDLWVDVDGADVTTENTKGELNLDTGGGNTSVTKAEGALNLDSGSGDVSLSGVHGPRLHLDSGSGDVRAQDVVVDRADLDSGSGDVTISGMRAKTIKLDSGSGAVDLGLLGDVEDLYIDSGSGSVTVRIPSTLGAELDVDAGSGGLHAEMPIQVTRYDSDRIVGRIGDGKGRIRIESGSGEVRLLKAN